MIAMYSQSKGTGKVLGVTERALVDRDGVASALRMSNSINLTIRISERCTRVVKD